MINFRSIIKMMAMALVMAALFCSCNAAGGSDSYESAQPHAASSLVAVQKPAQQDKVAGLCAKAVLSGTNLTFYYDDKDHDTEGTVYTVSSKGYGPKGSPWMSSGFTSASFDASCLDWNPTSLVFFFSGCSKAVSIDCTNLNTASVIDMSCMFQKCRSLQSLDLTGMDTGSVIEMYRMFNECSALQDITVDSSFFNPQAGRYEMYRQCGAQVITK